MENEDVEVGVGDTIQSTVQSLIDCLKNETNRTNQHSPYIYMVPSVFRDLSPSSFSPRVVSIGPLHREDKKLKEFEVYKVSCVHDLLLRLKSPPEETLRECVKMVNDSIALIRGCYDCMETYNDDELSKMMVMDGCFIIESIYRVTYNGSLVKDLLLQQAVIYDILLLENQIPFFVLSDIYLCTLVKSGFQCSLTDFIFPVLRDLHLFDVELQIENISQDTRVHHILGLMHQCYRPRGNMPPSSELSITTIHCVSELDRAGVSFEPHRDTNWSMAMEVKLHSFPSVSWCWAMPTLRMPVFYIHDYTELLLRNLMAYEQSYLGCNFVTSYIVALDMLINTQEDVAKLVKSKVLVNTLGSDDEAANLMNTICKEIAWLDFPYSDQWKILDSYYIRYWPKTIARFRRTYFGTPWKIIALFAGIVLFGLTVVQTILAIRAT